MEKNTPSMLKKIMNWFLKEDEQPKHKKAATKKEKPKKDVKKEK